MHRKLCHLKSTVIMQTINPFRQFCPLSPNILVRASWSTASFAESCLQPIYKRGSHVSRENSAMPTFRVGIFCLITRKAGQRSPQTIRWSATGNCIKSPSGPRRLPLRSQLAYQTMQFIIAAIYSIVSGLFAKWRINFV